MNIRIVAVGSIKQSYYKEAIAEYTKRMSRYTKVEVIEVAECYFDGKPTDKQISEILVKEASNIAPKLAGCVVCMDIEGKVLDSVAISNYIVNNKLNYSTFTFVIGGSYGLDSSIKNSSNLRLSLGKITLPHQLARVVLCEQLYRCMTIEHNVTYHK